MDADRINELKNRISELPKGNLTKKTINGKAYYYHRFTEDHKRYEKYIKEEELDEIKALFELKASLKKELNTLKKQSGSTNNEYVTNVLTGNKLKQFSMTAQNYKKRDCYKDIHDYIYSDIRGKVFVLFGLRRTGKTTLIRQIILDMNESDFLKTAFIQINTGNCLKDINSDLNKLQELGYKFVFIDEVTLMSDFIDGAALFSDVFASTGMKVVLSGTDSLSFMFAKSDQLYDRSVMLHTTFISYGEFESVLGIKGLDEYIRYGGTMAISGTHYNEYSTFSDLDSADEYVNSAIAHNIQHSLRYYDYGSPFIRLKELYDAGELTNVIQRVVEDINHRFTLEVLTEDFKSHDLGVSSANLRRDRKNPSDILDRVDTRKITEDLMALLEIRNKDELSVSLEEGHAVEIKEYLKLMDIIYDIDVEFLPYASKKKGRTIIAQPGLRYAQCEALIKSLLDDKLFSSLSLIEKNEVLKRIDTEIKGRMMEDIILLHTAKANKDKEVFVLQFVAGEFDMVVFDERSASCCIFEIKHSTQADKHQYRHLIDEEKCALCEHRYGTIKARYVIYNGESFKENEINYINAEEYLKDIRAYLPF